MPHALLVSPKNPRTFWSQDITIELAGKKVAFPPTALLTIAGMMPENYDLTLVDTNVEPLTYDQLEDADVVIATGMNIHKRPLEDVIEMANEAGVPTLVGGPLAVQFHPKIKGNATFFLGEAEAGFTDILDDIVARGYLPERRVVDRRGEFLPLDKTPPQRFDLIPRPGDYATMTVQTTRGCPKNCTFCDIPALYGKETRLKGSSKVIAELEKLYQVGWREPIMLVDDNFAGNQKAIKPLLHEIADWQREHHYPFQFFTQASLDMYESGEFLEDMFQAGFDQVFIGLESPHEASLKFMGAQKNLLAKTERGKKSMLEKVLDIQENYFQIMAGFILGFDTDPDDIADKMAQFIQEARISRAMVGPLGVLPGTPDYKRYSKQNRLVPDVIYGGDSGIVGRRLSYIPQDRDGNPIDPEIILDRHRQVLEKINNPQSYFSRTLEYFRHRTRKPIPQRKVTASGLQTLARSIWNQGMRGEYQRQYWKFLYDATKNDPSDFGEVVVAAIHGHHLITTTDQSLKVDNFARYIEKVTNGHPNALEGLQTVGSEAHAEILQYYHKIREDFRTLVDREHQKIVDALLNYQLQPA